MKFVAKYDIEAPQRFVYQCLADFEGWERAAIRRGVEVKRTDTLTHTGAGMTWDTRFSFRGKPREIEIRLLTLDEGGHMALLADTRSALADIRIDLIEMAAKRTRMAVATEVKPKTLGARLFMQSLRLARSRVDTRYAQRVATLAGNIESRYRAS